MNVHDIFGRLQAGAISLEEAKKKLATETISEFSDLNLVKPLPAEQTLTKEIKYQDGIAIVGMSGRYPEADNLEQYWDNLANAKNSIKEIPKSRWDVSQYFDPHPAQKGKVYCKWLGALDDIEYFDPCFFHLSPSEAKTMDPQHRIFLQESYKAFEDAGYNRQMLSNKKCGVYLGVIMSGEYGLLMYKSQAGLISVTGNNFAIAAARISYFLNLKGPALPIDTACSSSLVAIHLACQALLNKEIDMALVGGVTLYLTPESYIGLCSAGMLSPDGRCKPFDNDANGFIPGEGCGTLVLKRLKDAELDNDNIYGVIIGSGINQDGKTNGITAPSVNSQIELEREIYSKYNIHPESISYVEMHGTGTKLGDPIELEALATVFKEKTNKKNYCAIGSVKSNIGHTSAAAGMASIHKVLLSMKNKKLVPTLHFNKHNAHFNFDDSPFYVNTKVRPWERGTGTLRRACVSSFGLSGTNAHIVIEEYQSKNDVNNTAVATKAKKPILFVLSAKSEEQLKIYAECMMRYVEAHEDIDLDDMAYTLQVGREAMDYRLAFLADSRTVLLKALHDFTHDNSSIGLLTAQVKNSKAEVALFQEDEDAKALLQTWISKGKQNKVAELWVKGLNISWDQLYSYTKPHRISLPTYPFAKEGYWVANKTKTINGAAMVTNDSWTDLGGQKLNSESSKQPLQSIIPTKTDVSKKTDSGSKISLPSISAYQNLSKETISKNEHLITLSSTNISLPQTGINDKSNSEIHAQVPIIINSLQDELTISLAKVLSMKCSDIDLNEKFIEMGLDSIIGVEWIRTINERYGTNIAANEVYNYPTIIEFAGFLEKELAKQGDTKQVNTRLVPSGELLQQELTTSLAKLLSMKQGDIEMETKFIEMGLDSIIGVEWVRIINERYGTNILANSVYDYPTMREFIAFLEKELIQCKGNLNHLHAGGDVNAPCDEALPESQAETEDVISCPAGFGEVNGIVIEWSQFPELIHLNHSNSGRPVFWFHTALGGVELYQVLANKCQRPFFGIQARGWLTDRPPLRGIQAMASYYAHIVQSVQPKGPYDLGGYSLGGTLAYEVTRQLQELGEAVNSIVMLDSLDTVGRNRVKSSPQNVFLQTINFALLPTMLQEPEKAAKILINKNEIDEVLGDEEYFERLFMLAQSRGLNKAKDEIYTLIQQKQKVQNAYETERFNILPLPNPQAVTCYYFRNKSGLLYAEFESYLTNTASHSSIDNTKYWGEWERYLPNFYMIDVDAPNHMMLLSEAKSCEKIFAFCEKLYSEKGMLTYEGEK
ncbi:MAG TPA: beta-ketoacyl synthase N-terminal-like domain-containing protein [Methylomusa anaerophila]|uniref:Polyketide synthase PksL n=1 Tax=Methylomusa anaerophila TaxID=1930071 RepID=A0A348AN94_9FIRM|nr:beta-ketoacyl synthase N-terminal-like domain-containing protein [Methylomusa anaerophila]BBB92542.1 polyketide synthase PksL [Methylomusa anaerophila]HML87603.1 beta-ketoacyl synthase N-terminal-like domain-containing protein [Methylomusa anaerophila]